MLDSLSCSQFYGLLEAFVFPYVIEDHRFFFFFFYLYLLNEFIDGLIYCLGVGCLEFGRLTCILWSIRMPFGHLESTIVMVG